MKFAKGAAMVYLIYSITTDVAISVSYTHLTLPTILRV